MSDSGIGRAIGTHQALIASVDRLSRDSSSWSDERLVDEGLDLIRDYCWATSSALYRTSGGNAQMVRVRPAANALSSSATLPADWFPWGLAAMNPERFIFVEQAEMLPASPDSGKTLGELGVRSCLHLPILERSRPLGFLQVYWPETRLVWDDDVGSILRSLGHFLLTQVLEGAQSA